MTPEQDKRIKELRQKAKDEELTIEDVKEAVLLLREGRYSACFASAGAVKKKAGKKKKVEEVESDNEDLPF